LLHSFINFSTNHYTSVYKEELGLEIKDLDKGQEMGLLQPTYKIIVPDTTGDFSQQWQSCLLQLIEKSDNPDLTLVRVNIFVKSNNQANYITQHDVINKSFVNLQNFICPPFCVVMQEPEDPYLVICEAGFIYTNDAKVSYGVFKERAYCTIDSGNYKEYWTIGAQSVQPDLNVFDSSKAAFEYLRDLYEHLGITFNNLVRQWNYVGEILSQEPENGKLRQHYQIFNEVRSEFYGKYRTREDFPAATGIGMKYLGVCIDSFAVSGNDDLKIIPISNPDQSESYQYGQKVLIGAPNKKKKENQPPQFERAKLIALHNASRLLVSGTASIIGQDTIGIDDVEEQTRVTLQNIKRLSSPENLKNHYPEIKAIPTKYSYARVYVKYKNDIAKVRPICENTLGNTPTTYIVADICRDNLLVEIEAELVS
jgi:enamine deaminase RidA (YjgF/YER057c/UK114 family)